MTFAPGIAGSTEPEVDGVFVCVDQSTVDFFVRLNNTGGPVDVWAIDGVDERDLIESSNGFSYLPNHIPPEKLTLLGRGLPAVAEPANRDGSSLEAYRSMLTITFDDGTVLHGQAAQDYVGRPSD